MLFTLLIGFPNLSHDIPFTVLHDIKPNFSHMKVFGCLAYACKSLLTTKLDPRSYKYVHLAYKHGAKGYLLFDLTIREIFLSRDVVFFEHIFPFLKPTLDFTCSPHTISYPTKPFLSFLEDHLYTAHVSPNLLALATDLSPPLPNFPISTNVGLDVPP